jgi:hypothetical protein
LYDLHIGHIQASGLSYLYRIDISPKWILILCIEKPILTTVNIGHLKIHKQFPIQLACACTIHRSQRITLDRVVFNPSRIQRHGSMYTTMSCVRNTKSLYLLNALTMNKFNSKQNIVTEMQHLQSDAK